MLLDKMFTYFAGDPKRIQHLLKVYELAKLIGIKERIPDNVQQVLLLAAIVHDIGIRPAEEKYGRCDGKLQEQEGPAVAVKMLTELGYDACVIARVCCLVGHHHTYTGMDGMDYQILVEADFLVNMYEEGMQKEAVQNAYNNIFKTNSGKALCRLFYGLA